MHIKNTPVSINRVLTMNWQKGEKIYKHSKGMIDLGDYVRIGGIIYYDVYLYDYGYSVTIDSDDLERCKDTCDNCKHRFKCFTSRL